jgi:serine/threonine-protein kinase
VDAKLGEGGMGTIYRGTQLSLGRAVGIKTLSLANKLTDEAVQRFFREARILSQLNHPNIVSIIDFGIAEPGSTPFIIMELLSGKPLDAYVTAQSRPPLRQVLNLMGQICTGVAAAHYLNIVHRDLKPSNVFVSTVAGTAEPVVKLLDFGLAKPATAMPESGLWRSPRRGWEWAPLDSLPLSSWRGAPIPMPAPTCMAWVRRCTSS